MHVVLEMLESTFDRIVKEEKVKGATGNETKIVVDYLQRIIEPAGVDITVEYCKCPYPPAADSITPKNGTCADCGLTIEGYMVI